MGKRIAVGIAAAAFVAAGLAELACGITSGVVTAPDAGDAAMPPVDASSDDAALDASSDADADAAACRFRLHDVVPDAAALTGADGGVVDTWTGLTWSSASDPSTWDEAKSACASAGGRLPSRMELTNIVAFEVSAEPFQPPFDDPDIACFWTSTPKDDDSVFAIGYAPGPWNTIGFAGTRDGGACKHYCVTGPSCDPGGDLVKTAADEVTSTRTGLVWRATTIGPVQDTDLATACMAPYRVPNAKELESLVDDMRVAPATPPVWNSVLGDAPDAADLTYWASHGGWFVDFATGIDLKEASGAAHWVRCVR